VTEGSAVRRVPGADSATADPRKFTDYLLNENHTQGRGKAKFFRGVGYDESNWQDLHDQVLSQLAETDARFSRASKTGGELYEVPMQIKAPRGTVDIQTIWQVHPSEGTTFVTAHPL
jgi:hypothetical protein